MTLDWSWIEEKAGHPQPESNFSSEENSSCSQTTHAYIPLSLRRKYSPLNGLPRVLKMNKIKSFFIFYLLYRSVPFSCVTWYWIGLRRFLSSSLSIITFGEMGFFIKELSALEDRSVDMMQSFWAIRCQRQKETAISVRCIRIVHRDERRLKQPKV